MTVIVPIPKSFLCAESILSLSACSLSSTKTHGPADILPSRSHALGKRVGFLSTFFVFSATVLSSQGILLPASILISDLGKEKKKQTQNKTKKGDLV